MEELDPIKDEYPILFSTDMVQAIIADAKRVTRRIIQDASEIKYKQGDLLWVRESHFIDLSVRAGGYDAKLFAQYGFPPFVEKNGVKHPVVFKADKPDLDVRWRPSIHMHRTACRILLEVEYSYAQRLHDMTYLDALAEGVGWLVTRESNGVVVQDMHSHLMNRWRVLWDSINPKEPHASNPLTAVTGFSVIEVKPS